MNTHNFQRMPTSQQCGPNTKKHPLNQRGFTLVELIVSFFIIAILIGLGSTIYSSTLSINTDTSFRAEASELAFQKLQDYVNTDFDSITIGDDVTNYEVEDFSAEVAGEGFDNPDAKVYVRPASVVDSTTETVTENFDETVDADISFSSGSEITVNDTIDPTDCCRRDYRLHDNNVYNLVYNNYEPGSSNQPLPAIDLGEPKAVNTIRINWFNSFYTSTDFRIEGSNDGIVWNTVSSGLSTTVGVGPIFGDYPEDYVVNGIYRYWRIFNLNGTDSTWIAISEMEAFSAASGDVVEQHGSDASSSPGALDFSSSDIDLTQHSTQGQQSIGLRYKDVNVEQSTTIDNAYISFTADQDNSGDVELLVQGLDTDNAPGWSGTYAVDNAVSGSGATTANTSWSPDPWTADTEQTVDVTSIVQEILNRGGWTDGSSMAFAITYVSGSGKRVAKKTPAPQLVVEWSETSTVTGGGTYVDNNGDGDADNPTLLEVTVRIEYDLLNERKEVEFVSLIRRYGIGS